MVNHDINALGQPGTRQNNYVQILEWMGRLVSMKYYHVLSYIQEYGRRTLCKSDDFQK